MSQKSLPDPKSILWRGDELRPKVGDGVKGKAAYRGGA